MRVLNQQQGQQHVPEPSSQALDRLFGSHLGSEGIDRLIPPVRYFLRAALPTRWCRLVGKGVLGRGVWLSPDTTTAPGRGVEPWRHFEQFRDNHAAAGPRTPRSGRRRLYVRCGSVWCDTGHHRRRCCRHVVHAQRFHSEIGMHNGAFILYEFWKRCVIVCGHRMLVDITNRWLPTPH